MRITKIGSDIISVDEDNLHNEHLVNIPRVHIIKLNFFRPNNIKVQSVLSLYPKTNRYVIEDDIKIYNHILRRTSKKYYVVNKKGVSLISFLRKNNKILLNFLNLSIYERQFFLTDRVFEDILRNTEVIIIDKAIFDEKESVLNEWNGNVIIEDDKNVL